MSIGRRNFLKIVGGAGAAVVAGSSTANARETRTPDPKAYGMLYDATRCIGCKTCVVACADANDMPREQSDSQHKGLYQDPVDLSGDTRNIIKLFKSSTQQSYMKAQCMHCVDPGCASVCMIGAFHKDEHGVVAYDADRCVGCRTCQIACPFNIPKFEWRDPTPLIVKCELCRHRYKDNKGPACCEVCPKEAVIFGNRGELLADAKKRIADNPERYADYVYGDTDAGGTQVLYVYGKGINHTDLGLPELGSTAIPHVSETVQHGIYQGFIAPVALYAALGVATFRNKRKQASDEGEGGEP